jgi:hypothetical protein
VHAEVRAKLRDEARARRLLQAAFDRGYTEAYAMTIMMHVEGEHGRDKSLPLARQYLELLRATDGEMGAHLARLVDHYQQQQQPQAPTAAAAGTAAGKRPPSPSSPPLPGAAAKAAPAMQRAPTTAGSGLTVVPRPAGAAAAAGGASAGDRFDQISRRSGDVTSMMQGSAGGAGGGSLSRGAAGHAAANPWQGRWESLARFGASAYCVYMAAFPVRLMLLPHFYEIVGGLSARLFGGAQQSSRMRGGMLA